MDISRFLGTNQFLDRRSILSWVICKLGTKLNFSEEFIIRSHTNFPKILDSI
uniref:Uncharacterized protein n=1 Tax=Meloidogyne enterolobii TaxID=390850 RepID=A0A6V7X618_MELEN|nr:unnamed protein product [Meloidogyne enterolobii]